MSREYSIMNKSTFTAAPSGNMCPRHPGYELTYFNSKEGRKQCIMCIMHSTSTDGGKERFCLKHPGYENSFYCYNDQKFCCEKCLNYHKKHKLESVALKAENLRERFDEYKSDFIDISQQWIGFYNEIKKKKDTIEADIEKSTNSIEAVYDAVIQKLNQRKMETVTEFKNKAKQAMKEFDGKFNECETDVKDISQHTDDFNKLEELFKEGNNMEVIMHSIEFGVEDLIDNYCPLLNEKLDKHKESFEELKEKTSSKFSVVSKFNEEALNKFIDNQFVIKAEKSNVLQPLSPPPADINLNKEEATKSIKREITEYKEETKSFPHNEDKKIIYKKEEKKYIKKENIEQKHGDLYLHKFDPNGIFWIYQAQTFKSVPFSPNMESSGIKDPTKLKSFRSQSGDIYAFEDSSSGAKIIYKYLPDSMMFDIGFTLPFSYTKITITENKGDFYIGGLPCESTKGIPLPQILLCDPNTSDIESISSGLPKLNEFILTSANSKYLYIIPVNMDNEKIYRADISSFSNSRSELIQELKELSLNWEEVNIMNPNGCNIALEPPIWTCEVNDYIMILSGAGALMFNWDEGQIIDNIPLEESDKFTMIVISSS